MPFTLPNRNLYSYRDRYCRQASLSLPYQWNKAYNRALTFSGFIASLIALAGLTFWFQNDHIVQYLLAFG